MYEKAYLPAAITSLSCPLSPAQVSLRQVSPPDQSRIPSSTILHLYRLSSGARQVALLWLRLPLPRKHPRSCSPQCGPRGEGRLPSKVLWIIHWLNEICRARQVSGSEKIMKYKYLKFQALKKFRLHCGWEQEGAPPKWGAWEPKGGLVDRAANRQANKTHQTDEPPDWALTAASRRDLTCGMN